LVSFITRAYEGNFGSMENISLDKVLLEMERTDKVGDPIPFTLTAITCDLERKKGGERITHRAVLASPGGKRKAYHHRNDCRNIKVTNSNVIRAIHPLLITTFNGKEVYI